MKTLMLRKKADWIGITGSVLCIIHCLITPVLVMTSTLLQHDMLRIGFLSLDYVFIGINVLAVWSASRHASRSIAISLWAFLTLFALGLLFEGVNEEFENLAYAASIGLVITHVLNIRHHRQHHSHE